MPSTLAMLKVTDAAGHVVGLGNVLLLLALALLAALVLAVTLVAALTVAARRRRETSSVAARFASSRASRQGAFTHRLYGHTTRCSCHLLVAAPHDAFQRGGSFAKATSMAGSSELQASSRR